MFSSLNIAIAPRKWVANGVAMWGRAV
eukprot:SAG31_NODE_41511_length_275_cov_2.034091_1_plen_26_part_01